MPGAFGRWASADGLHDLLHAYFATAERSVGGLVRTDWGDGSPILVIAGSRLDLVVMGRPSVTVSAGRSAISVLVRGGLVVDPASHAWLTVVLERRAPGVLALVDLVDYRPRGGNLGVVRWLYARTQLRLHIWVGNRFLAELRARWVASSAA